MAHAMALHLYVQVSGAGAAIAAMRDVEKVQDLEDGAQTA